MKNKFLFIFLFLAIQVFAQDLPPKPNPPRLVNDFVGGVLSQGEIETLEQKLVTYNDTTSTQITVVIVKTVGDYDMNTYATNLGRAWGVGSADFNNGVVILWATEDRKIYIATGYGMEGVLPDIYAKRIVEQIIIPYFRESRYYDGLNEGTTQIFKYASGEYKADPSDGEEIPFWVIIIFLLILFIIIRAIMKNGGGPRSGLPYTTYTGWGRQSGNWGGWSGGGSGWGGGGWSGGGGGGFGGFGGGSFGGGGAGGSY